MHECLSYDMSQNILHVGCYIIMCTFGKSLLILPCSCLFLLNDDGVCNRPVIVNFVFLLTPSSPFLLSPILFFPLFFPQAWKFSD